MQIFLRSIVAVAIGLLMMVHHSDVQAMERFRVLTTHEVKSLLDQREKGEVDFLLINTLDRLISDDSSIPGSVNIPWYRIDQDKALLGDDPGRLIITYCMGYR